MITLEQLQDLLARIVRCQEAIEDGDTFFAHEILVALEGDLVGNLTALSMEQAA